MRAQLYQFFYVLTIVLLTCFPVALGWVSSESRRHNYEFPPYKVEVFEIDAFIKMHKQTYSACPF